MIPLHRDSKDHGGGVFSMNTEIRCCDVETKN